MQSVYQNTDQLNQNNNLDLTNYYYFKNYFSDEEINKIFQISKKYLVLDGKVSTIVNNKYRSSKIKWLPNNTETKWLYDKIAKLVRKSNDKLWNFNIVGFGENIQIGEYIAEESGKYDWHLDMGKNTLYRKISVSVQLSDPDEYEGGNLEFFIKKDIIKAPKEKGTVILFPSYFLHRVTELTKGTRKSLVVWISGPPLR
jgi:PKHD-type hydroxylase